MNFKKHYKTPVRIKQMLKKREGFNYCNSQFGKKRFLVGSYSGFLGGFTSARGGRTSVLGGRTSALEGSKF